jgi:hypothetical protein
MTELVRKDLAIRFYAISELELKPDFEHFIFGRPLFEVLGARGLSIHVTRGGQQQRQTELEPFPGTTFKIE